ncbi:4'-phosphopantetheinyl transferase family protein [Paludifilum halophilum]|uniref:4'-phosphopantetheinyl transferase family protein n=1 Tax=Paludifilum halophilum TaxID=1642702 RepID=UPI00146D47B7|nr:4'-phosphopantetheinyl transferase superfamily protein [Paludifilum halophilum]
MQERRVLQPGECHVWWARSTDFSPFLIHLFDQDERKRFHAYRFSADRDRFAVACGVMRLGLASYSGQPPESIPISRSCPQCGKPHGKPEVTNLSPPGIQFSISHAGDRVIVAFAVNTPVGVDVEEVFSEWSGESVAEAALTVGEMRAFSRIKEAERAAGFLTYWTQKEAVVKAVGEGFTIPPNRFSVSGRSDSPQLLSWPRDPGLLRRISLYDLSPGPDTVASLAVLGGCCRIRYLDGSALIGDWCGRDRADSSIRGPSL